jgi:hypothetical protein
MRNLLIINLLIILSSCHTQKYIAKDFWGDKADFPLKYINYFPDNIKPKSYGVSYIDTMTINESKCYLFAKYKFDNIDSLESVILNASKLHGLYSDSCIIIRQMQPFSYEEAIKINNNNCKQEYIITLPFYDVIEDSIYNLNKNYYKDYSYYLFDYVTNHKYISYFKGDTLLPKKFEHGFSNGVALNKNTHTAIYWIEYW